MMVAPIASEMILPNQSGDHSKGIVRDVPILDADIVNKKFVDDEQGNHNIADHNDTTATGPELDTLTDDSMADTLHRHSELSASDGTPDALLNIDAAGLMTFDGQIAATSRDPMFKVKDISANERMVVEGTGITTWNLNDTQSEAGSIAYSTPSGDPGIIFTATDGTERSQIKKRDGGGIAIGSRTDAVGPSEDFIFTHGMSAAMRLGIGIIPERKLHLHNGLIRVDRESDSVAVFLHRNDKKTFFFGVNASGVNNGSFFLSDLGSATSGGGTQRFVVDNTGLIGFGVTTPLAQIHAKSLTGVSCLLRLDTTDADNSTSNAGIVLSEATTTKWTLVNDGDDSDKFKFGLTGTSDAVMTIVPDGKVGIGETSPQDLLEVNGTVLVKDKLKFTQDDGNEYIDSEADGDLDIVATTSVDIKAGTDITLGDGGTTNYVEVSATGDVVFVGSGGLAFADICANDVADELTITTAGQANKVQITSFNNNGVSNNMTPDHTNDHITVTKAGMYLCTVSMSISSAAAGGADDIGFAVYKNNGNTEFINCHGHRTLGGGGTDRGSCSMSGIIDLAVNDTIEVWIWNEDSTDNVVVDDLTLSLVQVGGT